MQEVRFDQLTYLHANLPNYSYVGVGRDDGFQGGEYTPIFYNSSVLTLQDSGTFWLSTPANWPGNAWNMNCPRIVTWVRLLVKETNAEFMMFNTHWDHGCTNILNCTFHVQSAHLMLEKIQEYSGGLPIIITGDFNEYNQSAGLQLLQNNSVQNFRGLWDLCNGGEPDDLYTGNGWDPKHVHHNSASSRRIDHILLNSLVKPKNLSPEECIVYTSLWNGKMMSDHWAVDGNVTF